MGHEHKMHTPWTLHTDNQSIFTSAEFTAFAHVHNIELSRAAPQAHENQVSERANRTFQEILRSLIIAELEESNEIFDKKKGTKLLISHFEFEDATNLAQYCIQVYNNRPRRGQRMWGFTPNEIDYVLTLQPNEPFPERVMAKNDNSPSALAIAYYREDKVRSWLSTLANDNTEITAVVHNDKDIKNVIHTIGHFVNNQLKSQQETLVRLEKMGHEHNMHTTIYTTYCNVKREVTLRFFLFVTLQKYEF
jgi:hypothetical protein